MDQPAEASPLRKIIHVDMDAFFASVEQRDDPALRGRPVAVGYAGARGVVAAASYESRVFGVRSAMPSAQALRRCPDLIFVPPRFDAYSAISRQIRAIFARHTALIEPLALDEAYLDVTGAPSATAIARAIRAAIRAETGLTASAGVSYNKFLAKLASDQNKPDGLCIITPAKGPAFVAALPIRRFHGVGPVTAAKMARLGIATGADLRAKSLAFLQAEFGHAASYFHRAARGIDDRPVSPHRAHRSVSAERTYFPDLTADAAMHEALDVVIAALWTRVERIGVGGRTVTLKLRYAGFRTVTRSHSTTAPLTERAPVAETGHALLAGLLPAAQGIRLLGLTLSNLVDGRAAAEGQLDLAL